MPYEIRQDGPPDKPWCVYEESGGDSLGCHESRVRAERQISAIGLSTHRASKEHVEQVSEKSLSDAPSPRLALMVTSNAYRDKGKEIIRQKALEDWVAACWKDDTFTGDNPLLYWHGGDPIGDVIYADTEGPFLIEIARERPDNTVNLMPPGYPPLMVSIKEIWDALEEMPVDWGTSHEFLHLKEDRKDGVYEQIVKTESSVLPRQWAQNGYTLFCVIEEH